MKTEISRDSYQLQKRYSGVYQQQGRMLTDSDWNELVDILKLRLNDALRDVVGIKSESAGGTPRHRALRIVDDAVEPFKIQPGHIYADGVAAWMPGDADLAYADQPDFPAAPAPAGDYVLYADVWERTVTQLIDERLRDKGLHGADTCSRKQTIAQIKWCPDSINPEQSAKNPANGDAELSLTLLQKTTDADPCDPCAAELDVASKVGNYLFRVEVHDVQGDADSPTEITLKWSSENGAEQFEALADANDMPGGFIGDKWIYEFFDETSERHLGVQLENTAWDPSRGVLTEISEPANPYAVPAIHGSSETTTLVRRWDGYCKLDLTTKTLIEGVDRGVTLSTSKVADSLGFVGIGASLEIILESIKLELDGHAFVAGDFWLADVREAEHDPLDALKSILIEDKAPQGIEHRYLILGHVSGGNLQANPEADRKYAFPTLSEMTRLFMAGGDGQEIVPGDALPQPLRVGVGNGEWPVEGVTVRFEIEAGGGSIAPVNAGITDADGIALCVWTPDAVPGAQCRVRASLVDPDHAADVSQDLDPPVYFYANLITADQVAYTPACADSGENTIHSHLATDAALTLDIGADPYYTVKEILDALICGMKAGHIPYDEPVCTGTPNVKSLLAGLDFNSDDHLTIGDVLDTLLCRLAAEHVPYDSTVVDGRWQDINEGPARPETVQQAIDNLAENLESTDIRYIVPECDTSPQPTVRSGLGLIPGETKIDQVLDKLLCDFNATDLPVDRDTLCDKLKALGGADKVETVQDAINELCKVEGGGGCAVTVGKNGEFETLDEALKALQDQKHICICLLPGEHILKEVSEVSEKTTIKISGCSSSVSIIYIVDKLLLKANEIVLRDIAFVGGELGNDTTPAGGLILAGIDEGSYNVIDNCRFTRVFEGDDAQWTPMVSLLGAMELDWHGSQMSAIRRVKEISEAVLPDKTALLGATRELYDEFEGLLLLNPYDRTSAFEDKVKNAAKKIVDLKSDERTAFFDARSVTRIDGLPDKVVRLNRSRRVLGFDSSALLTASADSSALAAPLARKVSPKTEVNGFYDDIVNASAADLEKIIDRIRVVAALANRVDDALALGSAAIGGRLYDNIIGGHVVLFNELPEATELDWGATNDAQQESKPGWAKRFNFLNGAGDLSIHDNEIIAVHSRVNIKALEQMKASFDGDGDNINVPFDAYETLSIQGNRFLSPENSFAALRMRITGNDFATDKDGIVVAYAMAYSQVISTNLASLDGAILEQVSKNMREAANLVNIR